MTSSGILSHLCFFFSLCFLSSLILSFTFSLSSHLISLSLSLCGLCVVYVDVVCVCGEMCGVVLLVVVVAVVVVCVWCVWCVCGGVSGVAR